MHSAVQNLRVVIVVIVAESLDQLQAVEGGVEVPVVGGEPGEHLSDRWRVWTTAQLEKWDNETVL